MCQKHNKKAQFQINWPGFLVLTLAVFFSGGSSTPALAAVKGVLHPPPDIDPIYTTQCTPRQLNQMANDIKETLANSPVDRDFSFYVRTEDGREILYNRGNSDMNTVYESASTSKWVAGVIILSLVDQGYLSLDSKPQDFLPKAVWPISPKDPLYNIRLRDLLSFTSGLIEQPKCLNHAGMNTALCVKEIAQANANNGKVPGTEFWYSSSHLQVAGLMAVQARGAKDWQEVYREFQTKTKLFPTSKFDLPSAGNPRLAAGMHWTANEYVEFIKAYYDHKILSKETQGLAMSDQLVGKSIPPDATPGTKHNLDWHYGFTLWLECPSVKFDCQKIDSFSSPGGLGAYPFMNVTHKFYGIVARQEKYIGRVYSGHEIYNKVGPEVVKWATKDCSVTK